MAKEILFEQFNAVKQQIQGHVDEKAKQSVAINKQEATAEQTTPAASTDTQSTDSGDDAAGNDDIGGDFDLDQDEQQDDQSDKDNESDKKQDNEENLEDGLDELEEPQEDSDSKDKKSAKASEESYREFARQAAKLLEDNEQIALGLEQMQLIYRCFDEQGDLNISEENFDLIKSKKWITGHEIVLGQKPPSCSVDIYYTSESLKDTLVSIVKWIIKKIASFIEWIYDVVQKLNDTFSYDSMMDRFKSYKTGPEIKQGSIEHLIPEHDRLVQLVDRLNKEKTKAQEKFNAMYMQASGNPQAMELIEKLKSINDKMFKAAQHYEANKESLALSTTINIDDYSSIIGSNKINGTNHLYDVITSGARQAFGLKSMGRAYQTLHQQLKPNESKIDSVMITNHTQSMERYIHDNYTLFFSLLGPIIDNTKDVIKIANNLTDSSHRETKTFGKTYGAFSLDVQKHKYQPYGNLTIEISETDISSSDFKRIGDLPIQAAEQDQLTEFKNTFGSMYGITVAAIKANSELKCFYENKKQEAHLYSVYKDPASASLFYDAYMKSLKALSDKDIQDAMKEIVMNTRQLGAELSRVNSKLKEHERTIERFVNSSVQSLPIFEDKGDQAKQSLDEYMKKNISQAYLQIFNYTSVAPLFQAVLCYKTARYTIEKILKLHTDLRSAAVRVDRTFKYFIRLALVVVKNAQAMKTTAGQLSAMNIDSSYFSEMADKEIMHWTSVFGSILDYKKKAMD